MASPSLARTEAGTHPRAWARLGAVALLLGLCVPLHGLWRLFRFSSPWPRLFLRGSAMACGMDVRIAGPRRQTNVLYIANHVSWLDILVLAGRTGSAFVAKADMAPWPVVGWLATLNNSVYVQREQRLDSKAQAAAIGAALETGQALTLFPEGTTGDGSVLLPFRSSLLAAVAPPPDGIAIQPVAIDYGPAASPIAWVGEEPFGVNAMRILSRPGRTPVLLHFLDPLDVSDFTHRKLITLHCREAICTALKIN
ncbi:MAG: lysophospholipid acyltransferase family protein [Sphingopyxis sp.]